MYLPDFPKDFLNKGHRTPLLIEFSSMLTCCSMFSFGYKAKEKTIDCSIV